MVFRIQPHVRLHEWVAQECGFFTDEGLDYVFEAEGFAAGTATVSSAGSSPLPVRSGAFEDMQGRTSDVSCACHWAVNAAATARHGKMYGRAWSSPSPSATRGAAGRAGPTAPAAGVGAGTAVLVEALVTFVLVFVVVSVATDERVHSSVAPIAVGMALAVGVLVAGPVTGGAVNPVRALGPALVAGQFSALWAYIVGPLVGGIVAALLYHRFLAKGDAPS